MNFQEYCALDAVGLREQIRSGRVSVSEVSRVAAEYMSSRNTEFNFLSGEAVKFLRDGKTFVDFSGDGPLAGVPFLMKEGGGLRGYSSFSACRMGRHVKSEQDSLFVRLARKAGLTILGTTNVPEFCSAGTTEPILHGPARNPWNPKRSTGGSSGGSAAAVAIGAVPMAHGSDGGGSIRTPSHCCGVFGFVPTQGRAPIAANGYGFPVEFVRQHVITRSVRDSAVMLDVIARRDFSPTTSCAADSFYNRIDNSPKILKIAFTINNPSGLPVSNDCVEAVLSVARCLEGFGHNLIDASPMYNWAPFVQSFVSNWHLFIAHAIDILETRTGLQATEEFIEAAQLEASERVRQTGPLDIASHLHTIYSAAEDFSAFFTDIDILLTPTSVKLASELGARRAGSFNENPEKWVFENIGTSTPHLMIVNASGQPAMSVPTHFSSEGLPVGVQLIARHNDEVTLLQIATILETAFPWRKRLLDLSKAKPSNPDIVPKSASSSFTSLSGPTPTIC